MQTPLLYTFRRCPYAIRARLALHASGIAVDMHEVEASPKGTVPVLRLADGRVIDQSLDIMCWALAISDPEGWLDIGVEALAQSDALIERNDGRFKELLDRYKYPQRVAPSDGSPSPPPASHHRDEAAGILAALSTDPDLGLSSAQLSYQLPRVIRQKIEPYWSSYTKRSARGLQISLSLIDHKNPLTSSCIAEGKL